MVSDFGLLLWFHRFQRVSHPVSDPPPVVRLRIQWHVIIAVQRGVCVMLGLAKDMAIQAAAATATFSV